MLVALAGFVLGAGVFYFLPRPTPELDNVIPQSETTQTTATTTPTDNVVSTSTESSNTEENTVTSDPNTPMLNKDTSIQQNSPVIKESSVVATPAPNTNSLRVMGWIYPSAPGCNATAEYSDGRSIDILKPEFFTVNGGFLQMFDSTNAECNGFSNSFVAGLKKYSTQQFVTVSSASTGDMDAFFADSTTVDADIDTLVSFVVTNNLTGIELDFEDFGGWSEESYKNYKDFVTKLGTKLHANGKKLMLDGPAIADNNEQSWFLWRYEDFTSLPVDTIVIMLYDYQFDHGAGEPIAPLDWMKQVINRTVNHYPKSKLSIGIPSYGYKAVIDQRPFIKTYNQIKKEPGFDNAVRDARSGEMTWKNGNTVYFYQDSESIRQKIAVVQASGLNSISVWHLGGNQWFK